MKNEEANKFNIVGLGEEGFDPKAGKSKPEYVTEVMIELNDLSFRVNLQEEMKIDEGKLLDTLMKHSADYGWWASMAVTAKRILRRKKMELEAQVSKLDQEARRSLERKAIKVTEQGVRSYINQDTRVKDLQEEILKTENVLDFMETTMRAFEHRRDMLKEICRLRLKEESQYA